MKSLSKVIDLSNRIDEVMVKWGGAVTLILLRCYVAWQFLHAGLIKIQNWQGTLELFHTEYQVPLLPPTLAAYMGAGGELFFPCLLCIGLLTRSAALGLLVVNAMAVISYPQLWEFECPAAINDHFYWGVLLLVVLVFGAGRFSADRLFNAGRTRASV